MGFLSRKKGDKATGKESPVAKLDEKTPAETSLTTPSISVHGETTTEGNTPQSRSHASSIFPENDFRRSAINQVLDIKCDVMVNWLHQQQLESMWTQGGPSEGVVLKKSRDNFTCCPPELEDTRTDFFDAVRALNVKVAMTVNTRVIKIFLQRIDMAYVPLKEGLRLQIIPNMTYLPTCQKHHFAAFIHDLSILVVWDDEPKGLLRRIKDIEMQLMEMIWEADEPEIDEKDAGTAIDVQTVDSSSDIEATTSLTDRRPTILVQAVLSSLAVTLLIAALAAGWRNLAQEIAIDGNYIRLAFAVVTPLQAWLCLFFFQSIIGCLAQMIGPMSQVKLNSKFYSGLRSPRIKSKELPHVTIQCPVYKEGLRPVIEPTIMSLKAAISTYEMQGGSANIFVNDDGMQIISAEDAQARRDFYDEHNIGWVARPKHKPKPTDGSEPFIRPGKFKKASNMNYAMNLSSRVEDKLALHQRPGTWNQEDENSLYQECLKESIAEDEGRTWADGNIRIGDYILIVDSDTRVPKDCFLDAVSEMEQSPQVAIIQFQSGVMNVTDSFFERGITFFTNLVYTAITYAVANGDVAPFVGHNAILRWSAIQDIAYDDEHTGQEKYWSECTVSEDFDMALRLQAAGYIIRYASYTGDGFKEGVSLTVYDELARWEKYAYGCSELMFNPLRYWFTRGPLTPLFRRFITAPMPIASKITIMAYIGTYYAIASAWVLTLLNYFVLGWLNGYYDHYYIDSFQIYLSILVVFNGLGNVALAVLRYRTGTHNLAKALLENFSWLLMLTIFLGGCSLHVSQAIMCHLLGIEMGWGATSKEVENTSFFQEIPKLLSKFKGTFAFVFFEIALLIAGVYALPPLWQIHTLQAIWPVAINLTCHALLPVALNPNLMLFTW